MALILNINSFLTNFNCCRWPTPTTHTSTHKYINTHTHNPQFLFIYFSAPPNFTINKFSAMFSSSLLLFELVSTLLSVSLSICLFFPLCFSFLSNFYAILIAIVILWCDDFIWFSATKTKKYRKKGNAIKLLPVTWGMRGSQEWYRSAAGKVEERTATLLIIMFSHKLHSLSVNLPENHESHEICEIFGRRINSLA